MRLALILIAALLLCIQQWDFFRGILMREPAQVEREGGKPVLYATQLCMFCDQVRRLLRDHNIEFVEYDLMLSAPALSHYRNEAGELKPLLLIGNNAVTAYDRELILRLLQVR